MKERKWRKESNAKQKAEACMGVPGKTNNRPIGHSAVQMPSALA